MLTWRENAGFDRSYLFSCFYNIINFNDGFNNEVKLHYYDWLRFDKSNEFTKSFYIHPSNATIDFKVSYESWKNFTLIKNWC
ncbi:hypothetical protein [Mycoplasmopsis caviae]|uniref:Uncharacterized protein n=1 Tax=Mycoplasmopsis caviae TaxID=55603 RepID=A0A3P8K844_9BACT|nr:hypothetical protein [Mycoplasmopsis caviae]VDR41529.1 Uncharacterised protein [Mycoplasmopsis caviae]